MAATKVESLTNPRDSLPNTYTSVTAREVDFVTRFNDNWEALRTILGIMRPIRKTPGTQLISYTADVTLEDGDVGAGEVIPYSKATITQATKAELTIKKYAKAVPIEDVDKYGAEIAVEKSDDAFLTKLQNVVLGDFYTFLNTGSLTGTATTWQAALAKAQGEVLNKFAVMAKDVTSVVGFANILDAYDYLGTADITVQTQFGINYVKDFMGYSTLFLLPATVSGNAAIARNTVIATPVENIDLYYADPGDSEFARLGLAVVDEQHRFGVRQRGMLAEKAANPHLLVMSATPIPRTLGLLIYGDLDISILDELPPGRKPVKTRCITGKKRRDLYGFLDREIGAGRQVYIVCPAIEDTPDGGLNAVKSYYEDIAKALLPDRRVGLMHGKLKPKEKAAVMDDFKAGRLDALVSTTVIEVGVDVPNATVMVIENAERYGLSALHQLRGRVGRGAAESWCFLVSDNTAESVQKRLRFLCSTSDGFAVAQFDLETRGPGDFFGSRQHGLPTLQIADLMNDTRTLHAAQAEAAALLAADPLLEAPEHSLLAAQVEQMFTKAGAMN